MTDIKFCGLKTGPEVSAAVTAGARWTGFVVFPPSPRHVSPSLAGELAHLAGETETVAVTVDPDDTLLAALRDAMRPDWIQLHGSETPQRCNQVRAYARRGVMKSIPIAELSDLGQTEAYLSAADLFVFDARPPAGADRPGGWGQGYDYAMLKTLQIPVPWLLSGGLDHTNVASAITASGATAVDVSSGIETAPGVKDAELINAFAAAAHP